MSGILRYLTGTMVLGASLKKKRTNPKSDIISFSHADWADLDIDGRSISGCRMFVGGNLVTWRCEKQNVEVRFNAEAEHRAMHSTYEVMWIKNLMEELGFSLENPMAM